MLSERPQVHCKVLAALFGDVPFENTGASNEEGIIGPIGPWARRLIEDLSSLAHTVDRGEEVLEDLDSKWLRLFCNTEEAERFRSFDVAEIRAREKTVSISLPGTIHVLHVTEEEVDPPERTWICSFQHEGRPDASCGADFPSYKAEAHASEAHTPVRALPLQNGCTQLPSGLLLHVHKQIHCHQSPHLRLSHMLLPAKPRRAQRKQA